MTHATCQSFHVMGSFHVMPAYAFPAGSLCSGLPVLRSSCVVTGERSTQETEAFRRCVSLSSIWNAPQRDLLQGIRKLAAQDARERKSVEEQEFMRLRGLWLAAGGEPMSPGSLLDDLLRGMPVVRGGCILYSELWGEIDLHRLNRGLSAYHGGASLGALARDLALVSDRPQFDIQNLPAKIAEKTRQKKTGLMRDQGWKKVEIDWRRARYLAQVMVQSSFAKGYRGVAGYDRFAEEYFQGDSFKAYQVASALLTPEAFAGLGWGKRKQIPLEDQGRIRDMLTNGMYRGEDGYDRFALEIFKGDAGKAFKVASALLTPKAFARLGWGRAKLLNMRDQSGLREALDSGSYRGELGYDRFAERYFDGNVKKAHMVAKALLTPRAFQALGWGKQKVVRVQDQVRIRDALRSGSYQGERGYDAFSLAFFEGDAQKAYQAASTLLTPGSFSALHWGKKKPLHVRDQARIRDALESGSYQGEKGYDAFALAFFQGNAQKAYQVASAQLTAEAFAKLKWGKQKKLRVQEQAAIRDALESGNYQGEAGYDRFAETYFLGNAARAYHVARALLARDVFAALCWGKAKPLQLHDQAHLREALASGGYQGEAGYHRFSEEFFLGNAGKAYQVASALLDREAFAALCWGKQQKINVRDERRFREALSSETYQGEAGYERFAGEYFLGNMATAYQVASALLTRESFLALGWGKQKLLKVEELAPIRAALAHGAYQGEAGYERFAEEFFGGDAGKSYKVVSALLTQEAFAALAWGKVRLIHVRDKGRIREALTSGSYQGEGGYDRFAEEFFLGNAGKAYQIASALLSNDEFEALGWGKKKMISVQDQGRIREALVSGSYEGVAGYERFAKDFFLGDAVKAYQVASALLDRKAFAALCWGKKTMIRVQHQARLRAALRSGRYFGRDGRMRFVLRHFSLLRGRSLQAVYASSFRAASALLQDDPDLFLKLGWKSTDRVSEKEVTSMLERLQASPRAEAIAETL